MEWWLLWLVIGVILVVAEMATLTFYLLWLGIGCFVAALVAWLAPGSPLLQVIIGGAAAVGLTLFTRPLTRKVRQAKGFKDAIDQLVGKYGEVVEPISPGSMGLVRIGSETWSATCDQPLAKGEKVIVVHRGTTVLEVQKWEGA